MLLTDAMRGVLELVEPVGPVSEWYVISARLQRRIEQLIDNDPTLYLAEFTGDYRAALQRVINFGIGYLRQLISQRVRTVERTDSPTPRDITPRDMPTSATPVLTAEAQAPTMQRAIDYTITSFDDAAAWAAFFALFPV